MDKVEVRSSTGRLFHVAGPDTAVSPTDRSPCTRHDECPAVCRLQLPAANDGRNGNTHVSQIGRRQTVKAVVGNHRQFEADSLPLRKPVELTQHWSNVVKLSCSSHGTRCCGLDSLEFRQQAVTDHVQ